MKSDQERQLPVDVAVSCKNCRHFRQHYMKFGKSYREILYGHCVYPRIKKRNTDSPARGHYEQRQ